MVILWPGCIGCSLQKCGFEKVVGWECFYVHREKQLFLIVYVDDFKMAGVKDNIKPMWETISKYLTIDDPA